MALTLDNFRHSAENTLNSGVGSHLLMQGLVLLNPRIVYHLGYFISRVRLSVERLADGRSDSFNRRPFQLTWFASQISM